MAAAAVPAISLGAQYFMNRGKNRQINSALTSATTGLQGSASNLTRTAGTLGDQSGAFLGGAARGFQGANTAFDQSQNYFAPIAAGNRAAIGASLAPERAEITDTYRGAEKALDRTNLRGGSRDLASAELNRDRAGRLSLLAPVARANAAGALGQLGSARAGAAGTEGGVGTALSGQGVAAQVGSSNAYGQLFGGASRQRENMDNAEMAGNSAIGRMIFDALKSGKPKGGGSSPGGPGATSARTPPINGVNWPMGGYEFGSPALPRRGFGSSGSVTDSWEWKPPASS